MCIILELVESISKILTEAGIPRLVQDLMKILKEIEIKLASNGYPSIFILVDEFENSLPQVEEHHEDATGMPAAISQLGSLTKLSGVGFIITLRRPDWWREQIEQRVSKIEKKYLIDIKALPLEDSKRFILHRLGAEEFRLPTDRQVVQPKFTQEDIESIWKEGKGNPRAMLRLANALFRGKVLLEAR